MRGSSSLMRVSVLVRPKTSKELPLHANMITDSEKTALPAVSLPPVENAEKMMEPVDLDVIEAIQKGPREDSHRAHDRRRSQSPW